MVPRFRVASSALVACLTLLLVVASADAAPTAPTDVEQPGSQPGLINQYIAPQNCQNCHGFTGDEVAEPMAWRGGMMAHAIRDPLFWAAVAIAEQDFVPNADPTLRGGAGDYCLRCHAPNGFLAGRTTPTDGSGLDPFNDVNGVECEHCHLMVNPDQPTSVPGTVEEQRAPHLAYDSTTGDGYYGSGMYVINSNGTRMGPYGTILPAHQFAQSSEYRKGEMCGTCHDVSNPVTGDLAHNNGAHTPLAPGSFSGVLGGPVSQKAAFNNPPQAYGFVERTYSEWKASALATTEVNDYPTLPADLKIAGGILDTAYHRAYDARSDADFEDGDTRYFTCQTCHMSAITGVGCGLGAATRTDLGRHDLTGASYWVQDAMIYQDDNGTLRFGGGIKQASRDALVVGKARAGAMLESAAGLSATQSGTDLNVRITNLTGHKLISGYPEGRRMWLNLRWLDGGGALIREDGAFGAIGRTATDSSSVVHQVESLIDPSSTLVIEAEPAMDQQWAVQLQGFGYANGMALTYDRITDAVIDTLGSLASTAPGTAITTFHFVLNNTIVKDNRIPPYGFDRDEAFARNAQPFPATQYGNPASGGTYEHWNETPFAIPAGAATVEVRLLYQQATWEYIQFLWLHNDGASTFLGQEGTNILDAWLNTGQSAPYEMKMISLPVTGPAGVPGEASAPDLPAEQMTAAYNPTTQEVDVSFTAACDSADTTLYFGDLADVATYGYGTTECGLGNSGSASFDPGSGSVFFLLAGNDGAVEGSYGRDGAGTERPESLGAAVCDVPQDLSATCN